MGVFSWFSRKEKKDDDFESILSGLETSIRSHEEALASIRTRERRSVVLFTTYSTLAWLVYVVAWYFGALDGWVDVDGEPGQEGTAGLVEGAVKTLPVGAVPVLIFFTRRIVKWFYRRKQEAENKQLTTLRKKQRDQIDKLKKLSNYDKITEMLERHGQLPARTAPAFGTPQQQRGSPRPGGSAFNTPANGKMMMNMTPSQQAIIAQAQQRSIQQANGNALQATGGAQGKRSFPPPPPGFGRPGPPVTPVRGQQQQQMGGALNMNVPVDQFAGAAPQPKGFIDKLAEALLGGENEESPASKYALICQRCFAHNGLVMKDEIMDIQFLCPKCGFFNSSRRARMTGDSMRLRTTSSDSAVAEGNDESSSTLSPTLGASSESLHGRNTSTGGGSQLPTQDTADDNSEEEQEEVAEDKETSKMNADERKENLRSRRSTQRSSGGDSMETDE